jgi:hypothetical protein
VPGTADSLLPGACKYAKDPKETPFKILCYNTTMLVAILIAFLLFTLLLVFVITSSFLGFVITRVPFVPTSASDARFIAGKLGLKDTDLFYDLGSGDGKVCFVINKLTGARCVGFELTWWTHLLAKLRSKVNGQKAGVAFRNQNFFKQSWEEATVIYGYLYPPLMKRVEEKFLEDCRPGARAVIRDFPFPNLQPKEVVYRPKNHEIYIYQK